MLIRYFIPSTWVSQVAHTHTHTNIEVNAGEYGQSLLVCLQEWINVQEAAVHGEGQIRQTASKMLWTLWVWKADMMPPRAKLIREAAK